jgi:ABC-type lipoprotein release transport system permease subunit
MSVWRLVVREINHRRLNFLLSLLSVTVGVACLIGAQTLLKADRVTTGQLLNDRQAEIEIAVAEKQKAVEKAGKALQDAIRKQMLGLGFNVLILPEDQELSELHLNGTMSATMPEQYVDKLAASKIVTVNHLLPSVTKRIHWDERDREIILVGTRGEVPILHRGMKKPLLAEVAPGKIVLGHEIHKQLELKVNDSVTLNGSDFTVSAVHSERGSVDDVTVWINLAAAQELLGMQNLINAILALECECSGDRISQIRAEIVSILPGTQVVEKYSQALTRAETREKTKQSAEAALAAEEKAGQKLLTQERSARRQLEDRHAGFAAVLTPLVIFASLLMIGLLTFANTRQRTSEIGILCAIGLTTPKIMFVFLSKAAVTGLIGGLCGVGLGLTTGVLLGGLPSNGITLPDLFATGGLLTTVASAPLLAVAMTGIASWVPALYAARRDPAAILQGD